MKKTTPYLLLSLFIGLTFFSSCSSDEQSVKLFVPNVSNISVKLEVRRLEKELLNLESKQDVSDFLNNNPELDGYFGKSRYPDEKLLVDAVHKFISIKESDTLALDAARIFGDFKQQLDEIETAFKYLKYYYPDFKVPKIYTTVSAFGAFGFGSDFYLSDDIIVIGLDFFGGKTASFRPPKTPNYILKRLDKEHLVGNVMILLSQKYNKYDPKDQTMLAEMLFYGKAYYFAKQTLPTFPDSLILGYTNQEMREIHHNESKIWGHFVERNLFYESAANKKAKYVGEAPKVNSIDQNCPGRIGRWLGWQIAKKYASSEKLEKNLSAVMKEEDAKKMFQKSKYRPRK